MSGFNKNLWAPWRREYIRSLGHATRGAPCFLCESWNDPSADDRNLVVWRSEVSICLLNRFPYVAGHLLIAHGSHGVDLDALSKSNLGDLAHMMQSATSLIRSASKCDGVNVGFNLGRSAGAGAPDHLHGHVVPRWSGDTNFMNFADDVRVISESLEATFAELCRVAVEHKLRG